MESIRLGGIEIRFRQDKVGTAGSLDLFELTVQGGAKVPAPHYHTSRDETVYSLDGEMVWTLKGREATQRAGDCLFIPRGAVDHFVNRGTAPARALCILTPGVLGPEYLRELAALMSAGGPPDPARIAAIMQAHGLVPVPA